MRSLPLTKKSVMEHIMTAERRALKQQLELDNERALKQQLELDNERLKSASSGSCWTQWFGQNGCWSGFCGKNMLLERQQLQHWSCSSSSNSSIGSSILPTPKDSSSGSSSNSNGSLNAAGAVINSCRSVGVQGDTKRASNFNSWNSLASLIFD